MTRDRLYGLCYLSVLAAAVVFKLVLVSDLGLVIQFSPHDDSLYVSRAYSLLNGQAFGPYDSHTLSKLPGISLWLAGARLAGVPHLAAVNALYILAGLYFLAGMRRIGARRSLCAAVFVLYLLSPITMSVVWHQPIREPVGTGLFVLLLASMLHLMVSGVARKTAWPHLLVLAGAFAASLVLREEDKLLWLALAVLAMLLARKASLRLAAAAVLIPALAALGSEYAVRTYVEQRYGARILNDFSEGEFPRLMAAIRSVQSSKDNRLVMAPQETLQRLRKVVPEFAPVVERLPAPGPETFSCKLQGVCSEWSNGWMPWWIKDAAAAAGRTPDLPSAQRYFAEVRERIEAACRSGELKCTNKGSGLFAPFELRWTRGYVTEVLRLLIMTVRPRPELIRGAGLPYNAPPELEKMYRAVTMTHAVASARLSDALFAWRQAVSRTAGWIATLLVLSGAIAFVARWVLYPDVPTGPAYWIALVFFSFGAVRTAALAYVATFLGPFDFRMVFTVYTGALLVSAFVVAEVLMIARGQTARPR